MALSPLLPAEAADVGSPCAGSWRAFLCQTPIVRSSARRAWRKAPAPHGERSGTSVGVRRTAARQSRVIVAGAHSRRRIENVIELLAVVHPRIGYIPFTDQLVRL